MDCSRELIEELKKARNTEEVRDAETGCYEWKYKTNGYNELAEEAAALLHRTQLRRHHTRARMSSAMRYTYTAKRQHSALSRRSRQIKTITQR
jgi:hypothetical protein